MKVGNYTMAHLKGNEHFTFWSPNKDWAQINGTNIIFKYGEKTYSKSRFYFLGDKTDLWMDMQDFFRPETLSKGNCNGDFLCVPFEEMIGKLPCKVSSLVIKAVSSLDGSGD